MTLAPAYLEYVPSPLVILDENLDVVAATREAFALFGMRSHGAIDAQALAALSAALAGRSDLVARIGASTLGLRSLGSRDPFRCEDGPRTLDVTVFTVPPAEALQYGVLFTDVTRQLAFERDQEGTRNYLEQILDSLPVGIVVMDRSLRVTNMNRAQQDMLPSPNGALYYLNAVGSPAPEILILDGVPAWEDVRRLVLGQGEALPPRELRVPLAEGRSRVFTVSVHPLRDLRQNVAGALRVCEDITLRTELEARAREAELMGARLETLQQTAVALNHEIKNALTGMMTGLELMNYTGDPLTDGQRDILKKIMAGGDRIATFVEKLLHIKEIKTVDYLNGGERMLDVDAMNAAPKPGE